MLGGTFDPVHIGHVVTARQARVKAGLDRVWLMPNARPPHRAEAPRASAEDRLAMVRLAVQDFPELGACDLETRRGGTSYTIDSMRALERAHPDLSFTLLLGYDVARAIATWHRADELLKTTRIVVFNRAGEAPVDEAALEELGFRPGQTALIEIASPPIAGHDIRGRLERGDSIEGLVPAAVLSYISTHGLYRTPVG